MSEQVVKLNIRGSVAEVILTRPKQYNAFNNKLRRDLPELLDKLEAKDNLRVVIIRGSGPGFTAGADLTEGFPPPISTHLKNDYKPIFDKILGSRLLYIAGVHGSAAGIGAALAMACDFLVMTETAKVSMIFSNIGLVPDGGSTWFLYQALGYRRALEVIVEGRHLSASECLKSGLANKIFSEKGFEDELLKWAQALSERSPLAAAGAKRLLRGCFNSSYDQAFIAESLEQDIVSVSKDFFNASEAFLKKRKPNFKGE